MSPATEKPLLPTGEMRSNELALAPHTRDFIRSQMTTPDTKHQLKHERDRSADKHSEFEHNSERLHAITQPVIMSQLPPKLSKIDGLALLYRKLMTQTELCCCRHIWLPPTILITLNGATQQSASTTSFSSKGKAPSRSQLLTWR